MKSIGGQSVRRLRRLLIPAIVAALLALPFVAWAAVLVNDTFQDANSQNQALPDSIRIFNGRTATVRTDAVGSVTFQMGSTSSEGFWGFFTDGAPASLDVGDRLTVTTRFSFQGLNATNRGTDLRFGLFDSKGTRTTANTTGGINSPTFTDDTGYASRLAGTSGGGVPFTIHRRDPAASPTPATDPLAQVTSSGGEYTTLSATSTTPRAPLSNDTPYTLNFTVERVASNETRITVQLTDGGSLNLSSTATDTSSTPHTTFDWFGFRIPGTTFATHVMFTQWRVEYTPAAPVITVQPQPPTLRVQVGSTVNLSVGASGRNLTYQWRKNGEPITGNPTATTPNLQLTNVQVSDSGVYDVVVSNEGGSVESSDVNLTVTTEPVEPPPTITDQPDDTTVVVGQPACLSVSATGTGLSYQWFKNGSPIPGANGPQLCFASAQLSDSGNYHVVVSNEGGSVLSRTARLLVVSPMAFTSLEPPDEATNVCVDTPLRVTFNQTPAPGTTGRIIVHRADGSVFDTIDMSQDTVPGPNVPGSQSSRGIGGASVTFNYYPVIVTGNTASIYLHRQLEYNQSYYVVIEPGAITDQSGAPFVGISDPAVWNFTTRPAPPAPGTTALTVAADGTGDFCTVQGAVDFVPTGNTQRVTVNVRNGTYTEIVYVRSNKPFITVRGETREGAVIQYANNENLNTGTTARPVFGVDAPDFILDQITVHNTTTKLNATNATRQAEAFRGNNQRIWLNRVNLLSFQDTLLLQSQGSNMGGFVSDSYIEGDIDFTWGAGTAYFKNVELKDVAPASRPNAYYSQIRNVNNNGNVYVNCRLTRNPDTPDNSAFLTRIDPDDFPNSQVIWIAARMDRHINPAGWQVDNPSQPPTRANYPNIRFWEYRSTNLDNTALIDVSQRHPISRQLSDPEADQWSNPIFFLGGWLPKPVISLARPNPASIGQPITVNWAAPAGHSPDDWVGLYRVGASDFDYLAFQYLDTANTSGQLIFNAPTEGGQYEFRYFLDNTWTRSDVSNPVRVEGSAYSLTASPSNAQGGQAITVTWNAPAGHTPGDWVGLYRVGASDFDYLTYQYTNTTDTSGQMTFFAPTEPGQYEFRYFVNNSFTRVATSNTVTVSGSAYSLAASPSPVAAGAQITVNWTAPAGHSPGDWVGLYEVGASDFNYLAYQLTGSSDPSGTLIFNAPATPGQYEFRFFLNGSFNRVATSNPVTVSP